MKNKLCHGAARPLACLAVALLVGACAQTKLVDHWRAEQPVAHKPEKVAVVAVLPDALIRQTVEVDVAAILRKKGTNAVAGSDIPGMRGGIRGNIDTEKATRSLLDAGVDGVIVSFYRGGGEEGEYVRADYWAEYEGTGVGYAWGQPYFVNVYSVHKGGEYTDFRFVTLVESSYYDLETRQPVWRIVTETKDVEHTDTAADIASKIASQMSGAGLN